MEGISAKYSLYLLLELWEPILEHVAGQNKHADVSTHTQDTHPNCEMGDERNTNGFNF
jgi:hypothetical protein